MRKNLTLFIVLSFLLCSINSFANIEKDNKTLYKDLNLTNKISFEVFNDAMIGYRKIDNKKTDNLITIIDYSKPSSEKRLYVIDLEKEEIVYNTLVAHGKFTGRETATEFSNVNGSKKSSLGFFLTDETYNGRVNGLSLRLDGLEPGINDAARSRGIVIHGAEYANESFLESNGMLGRSWGCPAIPEALTGEIINKIKDGSVVFVYGQDEKYLESSKLL